MCVCVWVCVHTWDTLVQQDSSCLEAESVLFHLLLLWRPGLFLKSITEWKVSLPDKFPQMLYKEGEVHLLPCIYAISLGRNSAPREILQSLCLTPSTTLHLMMILLQESPNSPEHDGNSKLPHSLIYSTPLQLAKETYSHLLVSK